MHKTKMLRPENGRKPEPRPVQFEASRMLRHENGRTEPTEAEWEPHIHQLPQLPSRHPEVICNGCMKEVGAKVRFKCLDCADFDLCATCEANSVVFSHHFDGKHIFAKIRDSNVVGGNEAVNSYKKH